MHEKQYQLHLKPMAQLIIQTICNPPADLGFMLSTIFPASLTPPRPRSTEPHLSMYVTNDIKSCNPASHRASILSIDISWWYQR